MKNRSLLVISGPTASGKTNLALELAKRFSGELISADSRQVYQGMDIVTGKDLPSNAEFTPKLDLKAKTSLPNLMVGTYSMDDIPVWGLDLVKPDQAFDVTTFVTVAQAIIADMYERHKLPILVGGTGFYLKSLLTPQPSFGVPQNLELRQQLETLSLEDLQAKLKHLDLAKWQQMNHSDQHNPRRLIRAIEVATYARHSGKGTSLIQNPKNRNLDSRSEYLLRRNQSGMTNTINSNDEYSYLWLGLNVDKTVLQQKIRDRVLARIHNGAEQEVKKLISLGYDWQLPSMSALGYKEWKEYLSGIWNLDQLQDQWALHEFQYAKRQMTWFKAEKRIQWLTVDSHIHQIASDIVQKWLHNH